MRITHYMRATFGEGFTEERLPFEESHTGFIKGLGIEREQALTLVNAWNRQVIYRTFAVAGTYPVNLYWIE